MKRNRSDTFPRRLHSLSQERREKLSTLDVDQFGSCSKCKEWERLCVDFKHGSEKEQTRAATEKHELKLQISMLTKKISQLPTPISNGSLLERPTLDIEWEKCTDLESAIWDCSAVCIGDYVYAGGGSAKLKKECVVLKYSYKGQTWATLPSAERSKFAMMCYQNELVLIGGLDEQTSTVLSSVLVWDEHKWCNGKYPPLNEQRYNASVTAFDIYIVVAGGEGKSDNKLSSVEVYNGMNKTWVFVSPLPIPVSLANLVVFQNKVYIAGGEGVEMFSTETEQLIACKRTNKIWKRMSDIPEKIARVTLVAFGGDLLAIGGVGTALASDKVRVYFPNRDHWIPLKNALPDTYYGMAAVELPSGELLLVGGCATGPACKHVLRGSLQEVY